MHNSREARQARDTAVHSGIVSAWRVYHVAGHAACRAAQATPATVTHYATKIHLPDVCRLDCTGPPTCMIIVRH